MKPAYKTTDVQRARVMSYYQAHREAKLAYAAEYRAAHRDQLRQYFSSEEALERKRARRRAYAAANAEKLRLKNQAVHFQRYHKLTVEQVDAMRVAQGGRCASCGGLPAGKKHCGILHVDHDHATGVIRGLLCANCNRGIGLFQDSPARLRQAAMYLERESANHRHTA